MLHWSREKREQQWRQKNKYITTTANGESPFLPLPCLQGENRDPFMLAHLTNINFRTDGLETLAMLQRYIANVSKAYEHPETYGFQG